MTTDKTTQAHQPEAQATLTIAAHNGDKLVCHGSAADMMTLERIVKAKAASQPAQADREPSPTAGMTIAQRILHVGGRNNAAGYVEFGSTQAVEALVRQVLRDLPPAPKPPQSIAQLVEPMREVLRISDRQHVAWDAAKAALATLEAELAQQQGSTT